MVNQADMLRVPSTPLCLAAKIVTRVPPEVHAPPPIAKKMPKGKTVIGGGTTSLERHLGLKLLALTNLNEAQAKQITQL